MGKLRVRLTNDKRRGGLDLKLEVGFVNALIRKLMNGVGRFIGNGSICSTNEEESPKIMQIESIVINNVMLILTSDGWFPEL